MPRRTHPPARITPTVLAVCLLVLLGGGCRGSGGNAADAVSVDEQVGLDGDGVLARQAAAENLIRDCMKASGFEYVPLDPSSQQADLVGARGLSKEDFEKQYGYGITTLYEERRAQAVAGPNEKIRNSLAQADRAAYDRALYGEDPTATFTVALDTGDFTRLGGCTKQAAEQGFGGAQLLSDLTARLDQLDERILADPRMVQAVDAWSRCMSRRGYDLKAPDQVDVDLEQRLEEIVGPADNRNPAYDKTALAELQRDEVSTVHADLGCEKQNISDVEDKVRAEYERDFRQQNAGLLDRVPPA